MPHQVRPPASLAHTPTKHFKRTRAGSGLVDIGPADEGIAIVSELDARRTTALYNNCWFAGEQSRHLARHLEETNNANRRGFSPASARDIYEFRLRAIPKLVELFRPMLGTGGLKFVTIIQPGWYFPVGELHRADGSAIVKQLEQKLRAIMRRPGQSNDGVFAGMLEVGLRYDDGGTLAGYQLHVHAVADAIMMKITRCLHTKQFGLGLEHVKQPLVAPGILTLERLQSRLGYCLKAQVRGMVLGGRVSQTTGDSGPTTQHEPDPAVLIEPLLWLDGMSVSDLFIVLGTLDLRSIGRMGRRQ